MITVKLNIDSEPEIIEFHEFEARVRGGLILPQALIRFPVITGNQFVPASSLELFDNLYNGRELAFTKYFSLGRFPVLTCIIITAVISVYYLDPPSTPQSSQNLLERGAKSWDLMVELGEWWRLLSANFVHVSPLHLWMNSFFLFNLGGPTEAIFRRRDYAAIIFVSAIASMLSSALVNPVVSCGASGIIFGVWGALSVFGFRYRSILPERYKKYFLYVVFPYSLVALYMGIAIPDVDNWSHLGGIVSGSIYGIFLRPRLLETPRFTTKLRNVAVGVPALLIIVGTHHPMGTGKLIPLSMTAGHGLEIRLPDYWYLTVSKRDRKTDSRAYHNRAEVSFGFEARMNSKPTTLKRFTEEFIEIELAEQLEAHHAKGLRIKDPVQWTLDGHSCALIIAEVVTAQTALKLHYYLIARGYYQYILSSSSPIWLAKSYEPIFEEILSTVRVSPPQKLKDAWRYYQKANSANSLVKLGLQLGQTGQFKEAISTLTKAQKMEPNNGLAYAVLGKLLFDYNVSSDESCELLQQAILKQEWTEDLIFLAIQAHLRCERKALARKLLHAGLKRFPKDRKLKRIAKNLGPAVKFQVPPRSDNDQTP
ncbi:MAG: rhomboid family intramembrane serine protease [Myxococcota bacterium]|nr:rhomboid family intramembrane serine protease [Myxococcota bacterium]